MLGPGARVRNYVVEKPGDQAPAGWQELIARSDDGRRVLLRIPPDADAAERIRGEAALAKKHKNEALLPSIELVDYQGTPIQVLEQVDGVTLEALLVGGGPIAPEGVARVGRQVAFALVELHERAGVAHGALAADRVLIDTGGNARLLDVGCARPVSPRRMQSPERKQAKGRPSPIDDLWALGVLLADAALGGSVDPDSESGFTLKKGALPERLDDALAVLVAPIASRLTNATAAVRIFTELERTLGDGSGALRKAISLLRGTKKAAPVVAESSGPGPATIPDGGGKAFAQMMREAGTDPSDHPITQEGSNPRTMEMTPDKILSLDIMGKMSRLAEEAARRRTTEPRSEQPASFDPPPIAANAIHDEVTASDVERRAPLSSLPAAPPEKPLPSSLLASAPSPHASHASHASAPAPFPAGADGPDGDAPMPPPSPAAPAAMVAPWANLAALAKANAQAAPPPPVAPPVGKVPPAALADPTTSGPVHAPPEPYGDPTPSTHASTRAPAPAALQPLPRVATPPAPARADTPIVPIAQPAPPPRAPTPGRLVSPTGLEVVQRDTPARGSDESDAGMRQRPSGFSKNDERAIETERVPRSPRSPRSPEELANDDTVRNERPANFDLMRDTLALPVDSGPAREPQPTLKKTVREDIDAISPDETARIPIAALAPLAERRAPEPARADDGGDQTEDDARRPAARVAADQDTERVPIAARRGNRDTRPIPAPALDALDDDERDALGMPLTTKIAIGVGVGVALLLVVLVLVFK